jgi:hypothetical protein
MLKISLDESYVFDLLSIHEVKLNASTGSKREQVLKSLISLRNEIIEQIGLELFNEITSSLEYTLLQSANKLVFELVDRAGETKLSKETADANYQRYIRKTELQAKFFNNSLSEVKI